MGIHLPDNPTSGKGKDWMIWPAYDNVCKRRKGQQANGAEVVIGDNTGLSQKVCSQIKMLNVHLTTDVWLSVFRAGLSHSNKVLMRNL